MLDPRAGRLIRSLFLNSPIEYVVIAATAEENAVKESSIGREAILKAEVAGRRLDPNTKRPKAHSKILSVRCIAIRRKNW